MNAGEACGVQLGSRAQDDANAGTHAVHRKQLRSSIQQLFTARQLLRRRANAKVEVILRTTRDTRQWGLENSWSEEGTAQHAAYHVRTICNAGETVGSVTRHLGSLRPFTEAHRAASR